MVERARYCVPELVVVYEMDMPRTHVAKEDTMHQPPYQPATRLGGRHRVAAVCACSGLVVSLVAMVAALPPVSASFFYYLPVGLCGGLLTLLGLALSIGGDRRVFAVCLVGLGLTVAIVAIAITQLIPFLDALSRSDVLRNF